MRQTDTQDCCRWPATPVHPWLASTTTRHVWLPGVERCRRKPTAYVRASVQIRKQKWLLHGVQAGQGASERKHFWSVSRRSDSLRLSSHDEPEPPWDSGL